MNDKVTKIEFNVWANDETEGIEVAKAIGQVIDWYGQRGIKVTANHLKQAIDKWQTNSLVKQGLIGYLK